jgi:hypothetical protein
MIKYRIFILFLTCGINVLGQDSTELLLPLKIEDHRIDSSSFFSLQNSKKEGIVFFCPNNYNIDSSEYLDQLYAYRFSERLDSTINVLGLSYENMDAVSKNPVIDSIYISELDCFIVCQDSALIKRAVQMNPYFGFYSKGLPVGVYAITIEDKLACPKNLAAKIMFYQEVLFEIFDPQYTKQEQIDQLRNEINVTNIKHEEDIKTLLHEIEILNEKIIELDKKKRDKK